jgi:hypothetical protein
MLIWLAGSAVSLKERRQMLMTSVCMARAPSVDWIPLLSFAKNCNNIILLMLEKKKKHNCSSQTIVFPMQIFLKLINQFRKDSSQNNSS